MKRTVFLEWLGLMIIVCGIAMIVLAVLWEVRAQLSYDGSYVFWRIRKPSTSLTMVPGGVVAVVFGSWLFEKGYYGE